MGIFYDVSWADYLSMPEMNPSTLKHGMKSMLRLKRAIDGEVNPDPKTVAVGNAVHCLLSGEFEERYAVMPAFENHTANCTATGKPSNSKATSYYKEQAEVWRLENRGKEELTEVQVHTAAKIANIVRRRAGSLIDKSRQEVVVTGEIMAVPMKTRLDGLAIIEGVVPENIVWDLKTTTDISNAAFFRIFDRMAYGFSTAVHVELLRQNGIDVTDYIVIAAEVQDDYDCRLITVPAQLWENALTKVEEVLKYYQYSLQHDSWPGLPDAPLDVSNWAMNQWQTEEELALDQDLEWKK